MVLFLYSCNMKVKYELEEEDYGYIHDVVLDAIGEDFNHAIIKMLFMKLLSVNKGLVAEAARWGWSDTCVRDDLWKYMQTEKNKLDKSIF